MTIHCQGNLLDPFRKVTHFLSMTHALLTMLHEMLRALSSVCVCYYSSQNRQGEAVTTNTKICDSIQQESVTKSSLQMGPPISRAEVPS